MRLNAKSRVFFITVLAVVMEMTKAAATNRQNDSSHPNVASATTAPSSLPHHLHQLKLQQKLKPSTDFDREEKPTQKSECCENGGLCVMGVFCHCPHGFTGFRCEQQMRACGRVKHGQWARVGCNLCRCFDSNLSCMPKIYSGCDDDPFTGEVGLSVNLDDYPESFIEIFPMDEDSSGIGPSDDEFDYYDYETYDYKPSSKSSSSSSGSSSFLRNKNSFSIWCLCSVTHLTLLVVINLIVCSCIAAPTTLFHASWECFVT